MSNTLVQLLPPLVRLLLSVLLVAALARYLGVTGFGQYAVVFAYVALFSGIFADWGLSAICLREISQGGISRVELIGGAASLQALVAITTYLLLLLSLLVMRYPAVVANSVALYGLSILLSPLDILALPFQADLQVARLIGPAIVGSLLTFGIAITVIRLGGPLPALVGATLTGLLVQYGWVTTISLRNLSGIRPSRSRWTYYVSEAWPLGLATIAGTFVQQAPVLALSLLSLDNVGLFNAAGRIPQQLNLLPAIIRVSTFPVLSEAWVADRARFSRLLSSLVGASLLISVPLALLGIGLAEPLARMLFGSAFSAAALPFKILMAGFAITFPAILTGEAMIAAGFQRLNLLISLASMPLLIALLISLLPFGGAVGAAAAVLGIDALIAGVALIAGARIFNNSISIALLFCAAAAAAVGAAILVLGSALGSVPAATLAAAAAAIVLGTAERSTLRVLWGSRPVRRSKGV